MIMNENQTNFFVITGGPGVGKTSLINELSKRNFQVVDEDAREIIRNQMHQNGDALPWKNKELYAKFILDASIKSYENFISLKTSKPIFFDRGILDTICYMKMESLAITDEILQKLKRYKYNQKVFILPPWEEIYSTDEELKQDWKEAEKTFQFMFKTYKEFGYEVIEVPKISIESRADFVINQLYLF